MTQTVIPNGEVRIDFDAEQLALIKQTVCQGATDTELALFLYAAKRSGLDPLTKQIHAVKRSGKMTIQTGIDGYRLIAQRTGHHAGTDDAVYVVEQGIPVSATVTVYRIVGGQRVGFTATARWSEYYPGDAQGFMWKKMPFLMLGKVAESLALRKGFPAELSGMYTKEEMEQADALPQPVRSGPVPMTREPGEDDVAFPKLDSAKSEAELMNDVFGPTEPDDRVQPVDLVTQAATKPMPVPMVTATASGGFKTALQSAEDEQEQKRCELWTWLLKLNGGDLAKAEKQLVELTAFAGKDGPVVGVRSVRFLKDRRLHVTHSKGQKLFQLWEHQQQQNERES